MIVNVLCCKGTVNAACTQTSNYSVCVCVFTLLTDKMVDTDTGLCVCVCL